MYRIFLLTGFLLASLAGLAQREYFAYFQTEKLQPFYIQLNKRTYSSTASGYVILPKLRDSVYFIRLGFAGSSAVQDYDLRISGNDVGYIVRFYPDQGWGIMNYLNGDLQLSGVEKKKRDETLAQQRAREEAERKRLEQLRADSLAAVQATLAEEARLAAEKRTADSIATARAQQEEQAKMTAEKQRADSISAAEKAAVAAAALAVAAKPEKAEPAQPAATGQKTETAPQTAKPAGTEVKEEKTNAGVALVAGVAAGVVAVTGKKEPAAKADSLSAEEQQVLQEARLDTAKATKTGDVTQETQKADGAKAAAAGAVLLPFAMGADGAKADSSKVAPAVADTAKAVPAVAGAAVVASDSLILIADTTKVAMPVANVAMADSAKAPVRCPAAGTPEDVAAVIAKVRTQPDVELALQQALIVMEGKCFTTDQLRQIAKTRLSENWRYRFLEKAYALASAQEEFVLLADLFSDPYYLGKFKSMMPAAK